MNNQLRCQMTISFPMFPISVTGSGTKATGGEGSGWVAYDKCGKPAKFRNPKPEMGVEYVCGTHANSINKFYERTQQNIRCVPCDKVTQ